MFKNRHSSFCACVLCSTLVAEIRLSALDSMLKTRIDSLAGLDLAEYI